MHAGSARWPACLAGVLVAIAAPAKEHFLLVGGGPIPADSQVSIETPDPAFKARHTINRHQLMFVRDRYYVTVNSLSGADQVQAALVSFGNAVSSKNNCPRLNCCARTPKVNWKNWMRVSSASACRRRR